MTTAPTQMRQHPASHGMAKRWPLNTRTLDVRLSADLWGGTTALLAYAGEEEDRVLACQHFDAWGVRVATDTSWDSGFDASRYRWRSQEGSETDDFAVAKPLLPDVKLQPPSLVYMQTRHYDPGLGRFIMADSIPMGAFSPQGLNRYAYCLNDPVNGSDRTGLFLPLIPLLMMLAFAAGFAIGLALAPPNLPVTTPAGAAQTGAEGAIGCAIYVPIEKKIVHGILIETIKAFLGESFLTGLAAAGSAIFGMFMLGVALGVVVGTLVLQQSKDKPEIIPNDSDTYDEDPIMRAPGRAHCT